MEKVNIRLMFWYKRIGRFIYAILFALLLVITFIQILQRRSNIFAAIFLDAIFFLAGVILESNLIHYRERGTIYIEADKREEKVNLVECRINDESYFVTETKEEYVVKLQGETYLKSYKKSEVILEENPNIDKPVIEIITTEKISKPAHNEYYKFALIDDKVITENQKIIVKSKAKDIKQNIR